MCKLKLLLVALALVLFSALSWAQADSSSTTDSPPMASNFDSLQQSNSWDQLDQLLTQLEQTLNDSAANSAKLRVSLKTARTQLIALSQALEASTTQINALRSSLAKSDLSLQASVKSLVLAQAQVKRANFEAVLGKWIGLGGIITGLIVSNVRYH